MKYLVTLSTIKQIAVDAEDTEKAIQKARRQLDQTWNWDTDGVDVLDEQHPDWNLYKEDFDEA